MKEIKQGLYTRQAEDGGGGRRNDEQVNSDNGRSLNSSQPAVLVSVDTYPQLGWLLFGPVWQQYPIPLFGSRVMPLLIPTGPSLILMTLLRASLVTAVLDHHHSTRLSPFPILFPFYNNSHPQKTYLLVFTFIFKKIES